MLPRCCLRWHWLQGSSGVGLTRLCGSAGCPRVEQSALGSSSIGPGARYAHCVDDIRQCNPCCTKFSNSNASDNSHAGIPVLPVSPCCLRSTSPSSSLSLPSCSTRTRHPQTPRPVHPSAQRCGGGHNTTSMNSTAACVATVDRRPAWPRWTSCPLRLPSSRR